MPPQQALPRCKGPKLAPFKFKNPTSPDIKFHEMLGSGRDAIVWRVTIEGTVYAVKIFDWVDPTQLGTYDGSSLTPEDIANYKAPFNSECRVYGRLKETDNEHLAVRCFGHVLLRKLDDGSYAPGESDERGLQCLVKEYIEDPEPFVFEMLPRMMKDIRSLNNLGIAVWDVRKENYRGGRLVDLSDSYTVPHFQLDPNNPIYKERVAREVCNADREYMDAMIQDWNQEHPERQFWRLFQPNWSYGQRLRSNSRFSKIPYEQEGASFAVASYEWQKKPVTRGRAHSERTIINTRSSSAAKVRQQLAPKKNKKTKKADKVVKRRRNRS